MSNQTSHARRRTAPPLALLALLAVAGLLAVACGGSGGTPNSAGTPASTLAETLAKYAACMHHHRVPTFSWKKLPPGPPPAGTVLAFHGYAVAGVDGNSPAFQAASNTCQKLFPLGTPPTAAELHQQFIASLKAARCMRTHGFPSWPDPTIVNGRVPNFIPAGIDTSSPQYVAAQRACNP